MSRDFWFLDRDEAETETDTFPDLLRPRRDQDVQKTSRGFETETFQTVTTSLRHGAETCA